MKTRLVLSMMGLVVGPAWGQVFYMAPVAPVVGYPNWQPILQPMPLAMQPAPLPPPARERRVERYYIDASSTDRALLPPETSVATPAKRTVPDVAAGGVVVREYYFSDGDATLSVVPKEKKIEPPKPLVMPDPDVALKKDAAADKKIPESSTDANAGLGKTEPPLNLRRLDERLYVEPRSRLETDAVGKAISPLRVTGVFRSRQGGALLADMQLGFVAVNGRGRDRSAVTDRMGRFETSLEPGQWLVYFLEPEGGRRFLRTAIIELGENASLVVED